jgi:TPR repeat protein
MHKTKTDKGGVAEDVTALAKQDFTDGLAAHAAGRLKTAATLFRKAAEQGHPIAQFNLALMHELGRGVAKDEHQAVFWYQKAANQGHAVAQTCLSSMFSEGRGVLKNDQEAAYWFRKAADQGHPKAQFNLGLMYELGNGVMKNDRLAAYWYQAAAEQGFAMAQWCLGSMHANVLSDLVEAHKWFNIAYAQGETDAIESRERVEQRMTREQVAEAEKRAEMWVANFDKLKHG